MADPETVLPANRLSSSEYALRQNVASVNMK